MPNTEAADEVSWMFHYDGDDTSWSSQAAMHQAASHRSQQGEHINVDIGEDRSRSSKNLDDIHHAQHTALTHAETPFDDTREDYRHMHF